MMINLYYHASTGLIKSLHPIEILEATLGACLPGLEGGVTDIGTHFRRGMKVLWFPHNLHAQFHSDSSADHGLGSLSVSP
jgi:hypothetical protein